MEKTELFVSGVGGYTKYRIPALVVTIRGTVLAFCEARRHTGQDDDEIDIFVRRSTDGGRTWGERMMVVSDGDRTCGNPCPVVDNQTGAVILTFCKDNQEVYVMRSEDDGLTWSEPEEITDSVKDPSWPYLGTGAGSWDPASERTAAYSLLVGRQSGAGDVAGASAGVEPGTVVVRLLQRRRRVDVGAR